MIYDSIYSYFVSLSFQMFLRVFRQESRIPVMIKLTMGIFFSRD